MKGYTLIRTLLRKNLIKVQQGYTLIEILVVLSIIALLFGLGSASYRDFQRRQVVSGVADQIRGDLRLAQSDAITGQKPSDPNNCTSSMNLDSYSFWIFSTSNYRVSAVCSGAAYPVLVKSVNLPSGVTFPSPFPSPNPLKFKALGQGTNDSANWVLTVTQGINNTATITVTPGGEVQ